MGLHLLSVGSATRAHPRKAIPGQATRPKGLHTTGGSNAVGLFGSGAKNRAGVKLMPSLTRQTRLRALVEPDGPEGVGSADCRLVTPPAAA